MESSLLHRAGRWRRAHVTLGLCCALALTASGCGGENEANADPDDAAPVGKITNVEVLVVAASTFTAAIELAGTVEAEHDAVVSAEESGALTQFYVDKGAVVAKGDRIAQIDNRLLRSQVAEARAAAALAKELHERQERLWRDEKIGSEINYLSALHDYERAEAALAGLRTRLERTTIRAPFDGLFDSNFIDVGELAAPGAAVVRVVSNRQLNVVAGVPERFAPYVTADAVARVTFDVLPGTVIEETVSYVGAAVDEGSRTFIVEVPISSPDASIKPAMVATVSVITSRKSGQIVVPQNSLSRTENGFQVFVAEQNDGQWQARGRAVELGQAQDNRVVIQSGLAIGDRLITLGAVDSGDPIRVLTEHASLEAIGTPSGL